MVTVDEGVNAEWICVLVHEIIVHQLVRRGQPQWVQSITGIGLS